MVLDSGFRVSGGGFRARGFGSRVQGLEFWADQLFTEEFEDGDEAVVIPVRELDLFHCTRLWVVLEFVKFPLKFPLKKNDWVGSQFQI